MSNYKKNKPQPIELRILNIIGKGLLALIKLPFASSNKSSQAAKRWADIQALIKKSEPTAWSSAILKADSLLDEALKNRFAGETLGERLRSAQGKLKPDVYQLAWEAHKLRNKIAHEHIDVSLNEAQAAIYQFRTVLNNLGVL